MEEFDCSEENSNFEDDYECNNNYRSKYTISPTNSGSSASVLMRRKNPETHEIEKFRVYNSGFIPNNHIRNAVTGQYYDIKVGSLREHSLFKVQWCIQPGGPLSLYFDTPQEYEHTFYAQLSDKTKRAWNEKRDLYG